MFLRILRTGAVHAPVFFSGFRPRTENLQPAYRATAFQIADDQVGKSCQSRRLPAGVSVTFESVCAASRP